MNENEYRMCFDVTADDIPQGLWEKAEAEWFNDLAIWLDERGISIVDGIYADQSKTISLLDAAKHHLYEYADPREDPTKLAKVRADLLEVIAYIDSLSSDATPPQD